MYNLQEKLKYITGMDAITLQPAAGAHGELTGMMIIKKYFEDRGEANRVKVIIPDSAHGTNPASAKMCGFEIVEVKSNEKGQVDIEALKPLLDETVAAIMMTNPNTLGIFEEKVLEISDLMVLTRNVTNLFLEYPSIILLVNSVPYSSCNNFSKNFGII